MERVLLLSPLLLLLTGLNFYAAAHLNCGPVITPPCYIPFIYILLLSIAFLIKRVKKNQNRPQLLLKSARCEIPDNTGCNLYNTRHLSSTVSTPSHPTIISLINTILIIEKTSSFFTLKPDKFKGKCRRDIAHA